MLHPTYSCCSMILFAPNCRRFESHREQNGRNITVCTACQSIDPNCAQCYTSGALVGTCRNCKKASKPLLPTWPEAVAATPPAGPHCPESLCFTGLLPQCDYWRLLRLQQWLRPVQQRDPVHTLCQRPCPADQRQLHHLRHGHRRHQLFKVHLYGQLHSLQGWLCSQPQHWHGESNGAAVVMVVCVRACVCACLSTCVGGWWWEGGELLLGKRGRGQGEVGSQLPLLPSQCPVPLDPVAPS